MELSGMQWSKLQDLCQVLQCFEECTRLVSTDDAIISMSIPLMHLLMQSLMHFKEQVSAAEEERNLDDSQPLSGQGTLLDEVADEEEEEEEDDGDEYLWEEYASQGAIETGGFARRMSENRSLSKPTSQVKSEFHKVKHIPRRLRVSLRPTLFQEKPDFCQKVEGILNKCSMDIILLTVEYLQKDISDMDKQIETIYHQLSSTLSLDKFESLKQKMGKVIVDFKNQLQDKKISTNLRLKVHFVVKDIDTGVNPPPLSASCTEAPFRQLGMSLSSKFNPPKVYHPVETYISLGLLRIKQNCTTLEIRALDSLRTNKAITIKLAYKGGAIVVMHTSYYTSIVHEHLDDRSIYLPLNKDPTLEVSNEIRQIVDIFRNQNVIDFKLSEFLIIPPHHSGVLCAAPQGLDRRSGIAFLLGRVMLRLEAKMDNCIQGTERAKHRICESLMATRLIVASTNSMLSPLAMTLKKILTPLLIHVTSFIKDTSDFLAGLRTLGTLPKDCFLVTLVLNSLYTKIDHKRGMEAYTSFTFAQKDFCMALLVLVLTKNFFLFSDQFFVQKVGTAMGYNMAPRMTIYICFLFEEKYLYTLLLFQKHAIHWKRFIDDVFMIWNGDEFSLTQFYLDINSQIPNLTSTIHKDQHSVNFLDTLVTLKDDGHLDIDLYTKPTDKNSLLHFSSCHPSHIKKSLPGSQIHRLNHIITLIRP
ncbi:unnamed protein product [Ranitomeya imitator]|uniref:Reverse transcriptase domain-containing protein n=1 Tax=Ranitomeya imitator TaxID=111125 RepID=A0ABN9KW48_9NEOB|nr:unnamed protein product [Ranitomeya imitator]